MPPPCIFRPVFTHIFTHRPATAAASFNVAVCGRFACCALRFLNKFDTVHSFSLNILFFVVAMRRSMLKCIVLSVRTPQGRTLSIQTAPPSHRSWLFLYVWFFVLLNDYFLYNSLPSAHLMIPTHNVSPASSAAAVSRTVGNPKCVREGLHCIFCCVFTRLSTASLLHPAHFYR